MRKLSGVLSASSWVLRIMFIRSLGACDGVRDWTQRLVCKRRKDYTYYARRSTSSSWVFFWARRPLISDQCQMTAEENGLNSYPYENWTLRVWEVRCFFIYSYDKNLQSLPRSKKRVTQIHIPTSSNVSSWALNPGVISA